MAADPRTPVYGREAIVVLSALLLYCFAMFPAMSVKARNPRSSIMLFWKPIPRTLKERMFDLWTDLDRSAAVEITFSEKVLFWGEWD
jgi:hypothetical protein